MISLAAKKFIHVFKSVRGPPIGVQRAPRANGARAFPHMTNVQCFELRIQNVRFIATRYRC